MTPSTNEARAGERLLAFGFHPVPVPSGSSFDRRGDLARLAAVRAAAGVGVGWELRWTAGPSGGFSVAVSSAAGVRWVEGCLAPAYGHGQWRRLRPPSADWVCRRVARRSIWGRPLDERVASEPPNVGDALFTGIAGLPSGSELRWAVAPSLDGPRAPAAAPTRTVVLPRGSTRLPETTAELRQREMSHQHGRFARWVSHLSIWGSLVSPEAGVRGLEQLLASELRWSASADVAFRPPGHMWGRPDPAVWLTDLELSALLPSGAAIGPSSFAGPATSGGREYLLGAGARGEPVRVAVPEREGRHLVLLGATGMGKTTALLRLLGRASRDGGVVLFDPFGDTAARFLRALPSPLANRAVWISPSRSPVPVNALSTVRGAGDTERGAADLVEALRQVRAGRYPSSPFWGPRIEETAFLAIRAASAVPEGTLVDAAGLLEVAGGRVGPVPVESEAAVAALRRRVLERPEEVDGTRRLLGEITDRPTLARLLAERRPVFSWREAVERSGLVVVSGDAAEVGESTARYLLAVHLSLLWAELVRRRGRQKVIVALDEAQLYAHGAAAEMLRTGRRLNAQLWLVTQSLASLPDDLQEAVHTNVGDVVLFRGSPEEAKEVARWVPGVEVSALSSLRKGEALFLRGRGESLEWVSVRPEPGGRVEALDQVLEASRKWLPNREESIPSGSGPSSVPLRPGTDGEVGERDVLVFLWAGLLADEATAMLPILLPRARRTLGSADGAVRAAGARLQRAGLLEESSPSPTGRIWSVRREGFAAVLGGSVGPDELARGRRRWEAYRRGEEESVGDPHAHEFF